MEFVKAMKIKGKMCNELDCDDCPLSIKNRKSNASCVEFMIGQPEQAELILDKWDKEHPQKTMLMDFMEKHPNAPLNKNNGTPNICPADLGYEKEQECSIGCLDCWNRPLQEG